MSVTGSAAIDATTTGAPPQRVTLAWAWLPPGEYAEALRLWPELTEPGAPAQGGRDHAEYCRDMQAKLVQATDAGARAVRLTPIRLPEFLAWCAEREQDPGAARAGYAAHLARTRPDELIAWPPGRNDACWCGSGRKYKKCCAAPQAG